MKKLMMLLFLIVVGGAVVGEIVAPRLVADRMEEKTRAETRGAVEVAVDIDSFPFVARLVGTGMVKSVSVTLEEVVQYDLPLASIRFDAEGVRLDQSALIERDVRVRDVESVTIRAEITEAALSDATGIDVSLGDVEAAEGVLDISGSSVPLPGEVLPCSPEVRPVDDRLRLSCTVQELPALLQRALADNE